MNYKDVIHLLGEVTGIRNRISFPLIFVRYMGSYEGAAFLNQLMFWSSTKEDGWFYKSHEEWEAELGLSSFQVRRLTKQCQDMGFLETKLQKVNGAPTLHYHLDYEVCTNGLLSRLTIDSEAAKHSLDSEAASHSINRSYTDQTNRSNSGLLKNPDLRLPEEDAIALLKACYERIGKFVPNKGDGAKELKVQALDLVERYGFETCHRMIAKVKERHDKLISLGEKGIASPIGYLGSILQAEEEQPKEHFVTYETPLTEERYAEDDPEW